MGYNHIFISKEDEAKTAFRCPGAVGQTNGLFCWQVMPFGLNKARVTYQRAMNLIFHYFIVNIVEVVYIYDVVVQSFPVEGHLSDLKTVFERENTA